MLKNCAFERPIEQLERRVMLAAVPEGPELRVNTYTSSDQQYPAVATDPAGNFLIAWNSSGQEGSDTGVYAQRYDSAGVPQGGEFRVNSHTTNHQFNPSVAMDDDGDFVIAWASYRQDGSDWGIYAQRYDAAGTPEAAEFRVNTLTTRSQYWPSAAMSANGDFVVTWQGSESGVERIFAQRYDALGVPQGAEFRVSSLGGIQIRPSAAMDVDGDFVIAWRSDYDGSKSGILARRYDAAGIAQGDQFLVNAFTESSQDDPSAAMDADGDFVIVWRGPGSPGSGVQINAQRYNASGVPQGSQFRVSSDSTGSKSWPRVAVNHGGDFVVTWVSGGQDGSDDGVYAQRFNRTGIAQGGEFRVNAYTTQRQTRPRLAIDENGDFVVAWASRLQDGGGYGIYAQQYRLVPAVSASSFHFATAPQHLRLAFDENVSHSLGSDDVVVQNLTTGQTIASSDFALAYDADTNTATLEYTGAGGGIGSVLPDGNYRATLVAAGVTTPNGTPLSGDHVLEFFFLNGDANRDGRVNLDDFNILAAHFGQGGPQIDFTNGDFTFDGIVNLNDFNILAGRFGSVLAGPVAGRVFAAHPLGGSRDRDTDDPLEQVAA